MKKELGTNVSQPSSIDPFQEVLKSMKARKDSPKMSTPPPASASVTVPLANTLNKLGKKKKSVSWAPDSQLESIKLIDRAIYDDDPVDVSVLFVLTCVGCSFSFSSYLRDHILYIACAIWIEEWELPFMLIYLKNQSTGLNQCVRTKSNTFSSMIERIPPAVLELPKEIYLPLRGQESQERITQEEREQTALGALYMSSAHIPDSPSEPSSVISEDQVDRAVKIMTCGPEVDVFWSGPPMLPNQSIAELVSQLTPDITATSMASMEGQLATASSLDLKSVGIDASAVAALQNLPLEHLQFLQQYAQQQQQQQGMYDQPPYGGGVGGGLEQNWNGQFAIDYGQGSTDDRDRRWVDGKGRGRGARGRGRGRGDDGGFRNSKRKPCSFYPIGRRALNHNNAARAKG